MRSLSAIRRSPVESCVEDLKPVWGMEELNRIPLNFGDSKEEFTISKVLGLADRSLLSRIGLKGLNAVSWACEHGVNVPQEIFGWNMTVDGSLVIRLGINELFLEGKYVQVVEEAIAHGISDVECFLVRREDAGFLLTGCKALEVLAQTCSYDFQVADTSLIMTQLAGVSCSILAREVKNAADVGQVPIYHIWTSASYSRFMWKELIAIVEDCGGGPVGDEAIGTLFSGR